MALLAFFTSRLGMEILGVVALACVGLGYYHHVWHNGYVKGEASVQKEWDADKQARLHAFTDMTTKWTVAQGELEKAQGQLATERQGRIDDAKQRARNLPPADAGLRFPGSAVSVLDDAGGDSTSPARPSGKPAASAAPVAEDSTVGLVTQWAVDVIGLYNACRDEVVGWQGFYAALRAAQPKEVK